MFHRARIHLQWSNFWLFSPLWPHPSLSDWNNMNTKHPPPPPCIGWPGMAGKQMPEEQPVGLDQQEGLGVLQGVDVFVTKFFLRQGIIVQCESHRPGLLGAATCFLIPRALKLLGVLGGRGVIPSCSPEGIYLFTAGRQNTTSIISQSVSIYILCFHRIQDSYIRCFCTVS